MRDDWVDRVAMVGLVVVAALFVLLFAAAVMGLWIAVLRGLSA